ncbi:Predicted arabinose efflux permease, MFS family [Pseudonocardia ammonioxydans]|uniref:Predicted arabinose efflux permease, MFS family n=1 Tax=Pseudonocardia ammonioxydans TaxID=260086 RepID=A0A1I4TY30_PSUAM|nr:MFS transporter [Pseudonocardia ammonioxydans]SFM81549.1 Predicted arabinose efflux permease, MFS family [Pseudonocardia ammonioxydans]
MSTGQAGSGSAVTLEYTPGERRRILGAACLGWGMEYFDFMLPSLLAGPIMAEYGITPATFSLAIVVQLIGSAVGGVLFGWLGDRFGRRRTLIWSILIYSIATGLVFFAPNFTVFVVLRFLTGVGTGGEWAVGFAWLNEAWSPKRRGLGGGLVQSSLWPAYALAILAAQLVPDWRTAFLLGVLPALACVWVRIATPESKQWTELQRRKAAGELTPEVAAQVRRSGWAQLLSRDSLPIVAVGVVAAFGAQWVPYTATTWMPSLLREDLGYESGSASLVLYLASAVSFVAFILAGYLSDRLGRRSVFLTFSGLQAVTFAVMLGIAVTGSGMGNLAWLYLVSSFFLGYFGIFGVWFGELFPTRLRSLGSAAAYNIGRGLSGLGTLIGGIIATTEGYGIAVGIAVFGAVLVFGAAYFLRDRAGRVITAED